MIGRRIRIIRGVSDHLVLGHDRRVRLPAPDGRHFDRSGRDSGVLGTRGAYKFGFRIRHLVVVLAVVNDVTLVLARGCFSRA